jgi:hypothetical protein
MHKLLLSFRSYYFEVYYNLFFQVFHLMNVNGASTPSAECKPRIPECPPASRIRGGGFAGHLVRPFGHTCRSSHFGGFASDFARYAQFAYHSVRCIRNPSLHYWRGDNDFGKADANEAAEDSAR